jgi:chemotaxis-related protein WspB
MEPPILYALIRLGADQYAIDASLVVEVLPLVRLRTLSGAPVGAAGLMSYRGSAVPVLDLNLLALGVATPSRLMTRIVIVRYPKTPQRPDSGLLGLLVPEVLRVTHIDPGSFRAVGLESDDARYLGPVLVTAEGVLQRIEVAALLTDELRSALFRTELAA